MDLRPLYQRSRALFLANAPHASRHRPGLRAARALPCVSERCGSDADALAAAALAAGDSDPGRDRVAFSGDQPTGVAFGESFTQSVSQSFSDANPGRFGGSLGIPGRLSLTERIARLAQCLANGLSRAVRIPRA